MAEENAAEPEAKEEPVVLEQGGGTYEAPDFEDGEVDGDEPGKQAEAPEGEQAAGEEAPEWDDSILKTAEQYGFTADEAKAYGSRDAFERTLVALDRQASKFGRERLQVEAQQEQAAGPPRDEYGRFVKREEQQPTSQQQQQAANEYKKYELGISETEWDPETVKVLQGLNDHYDQVSRQQQERLELTERVLSMIGERFVQDTGKSQADDSMKLTTEMDAFFGGLGDEFKDTFGKEAVNKLLASSPQVAARNQLVEEMMVLKYADAQSNRPAQSYPELAQRALRSLHFDKFQATARKQITEQLKQRQGQQIARVSGQNGKPKNRLEAAIKRVEDVYRSKGFSLADDEEAIEV